MTGHGGPKATGQVIRLFSSQAVAIPLDWPAMTSERIDPGTLFDELKLRFVGQDEDDNTLHELRASHVAEVLQGVVGLVSDFEKAGAFGEGMPAEVLVRPAESGSFVMEIVRWIEEYPTTSGILAGSVPTIASAIYLSTKSMRADVSEFEYIDNGNVKITWQDNTVNEVSRAMWKELNTRKRRRKKQLRQIMAPLSDPAVTSLEVSDETPTVVKDEAPERFVLERADYQAVVPEDEITEHHRIFETEALMGSVDFDSGEKWRVKTLDGSRSATVEDKDFLSRIDSGLALHKSDIFNLKIREDLTEKNGKTRRKWTVLEVLGHRRSAGDDDA